MLNVKWQPSAKIGRSLEPFARAAWGSESGPSDNAPQTAGFDPQQKPHLAKLVNMGSN